MPIRYGSTSITAVNYGSTSVGTVNYGSTRVFPNNLATISVSTNDTAYGEVYISTNRTATSGSTSLTVPFSTGVYFFVKLKRQIEEYVRNTGWTKISGTDWSANAIYRVDGYVYDSDGGIYGISGRGNTFNTDKSFIYGARTINISIDSDVGDWCIYSNYDFDQDPIFWKITNNYYDYDLELEYSYDIETSSDSHYDDDDGAALKGQGNTLEIFNIDVDSGVQYAHCHALITSPSKTLNPAEIEHEY